MKRSRHLASTNRLIGFLPARYRKKARLILFLLSLISGVGGSFFLQGKVIRVADGDTVTILTGPATVQKIRLYGIDSPETNQPFGEEAKEFTASRVLWQQVQYQEQDTDRYGRSVALITLENGEVLNELLVAEGLAWVYPQYCNIPVCNRWKRLENSAKLSRKGLWRQRGPIPPWRWRAKNRR